MKDKHIMGSFSSTRSYDQGIFIANSLNEDDHVGGMKWYLVGSNLSRQQVAGMEGVMEKTTLLDPVENVQSMRSHETIWLEVVCTGLVRWRILVLQNFPTSTLMVYVLWPGDSEVKHHNDEEPFLGTYYVHRVTSEKAELCVMCAYTMDLQSILANESVHSIRALCRKTARTSVPNISNECKRPSRNCSAQRFKTKTTGR